MNKQEKQELYTKYVKTLQELGQMAKELDIRFLFMDSQDNLACCAPTGDEIPFLISKSMADCEFLEKSVKFAVEMLPVTKSAVQKIAAAHEVDKIVRDFLKENGFKSSDR